VKLIFWWLGIQLVVALIAIAIILSTKEKS
jgi:hypothetical protein